MNHVLDFNFVLWSVLLNKNNTCKIKKDKNKKQPKA